MSAIHAMPTLFRMGCLAGTVWLASLAHGQESPTGESGSVTPLIRQMVGTWSVQSRMWPGPNAKAVDLLPGMARRSLVTDAYLQEVMESADKTGGPQFTRSAYFSYNVINRQYEYFSLDSRLPQMMGYVVPGANRIRGDAVELAGASFVAPEWGTRKNVPFMYRLTIGQWKEGGRSYSCS